MYKLRQVLRITMYNYSGWKTNPKVWLTFILGFVLCLMLTENALQFSKTYDTSMQILEPFMWTFGDANSVMISSLLLLILFGDMPFIMEATPYQLVRCSRKIWLLGQILYVVSATVVYLLFLVILESVFVVSRAYIGNVWSETGAMIAYSDLGQEVALPVSLKAMEISTPYLCASTLFLLVLFYCLFLVSILLVGNLSKYPMLGNIMVIGINVYGLLLNPVVFQNILKLSDDLFYKANLLTGWLSPLNHATYYMHNFGYDFLPRIWMSIALFSGFIFIFIMNAMKKMRQYNFVFTQTISN